MCYLSPTKSKLELILIELSMALIIFYVYYNGEMTYSDEAFSTKGRMQI